MRPIIKTVLAYLAFNVAVWLSLGEGGMWAIAVANLLGGVFTVIAFRKELSANIRPALFISAMQGIGILLIVVGLRVAHGTLPVSISMEMVYNFFALLSWPLFAGLFLLFPTSFSDRPNRFDLGCHAVMAVLVFTRIWLYHLPLEQLWQALGPIATAVLGYMLFNTSIKLAKGHRATNICGNVFGGGFIIAAAVVLNDHPTISEWHWKHAAGAVLGGLAIYGIVKFLGESYAHFGKRGKASLVPPLVYDGILVASPLVIVVTFEHVPPATLLVAIGMLVVTMVRYQWHMNARTS